MMDDDDMELFDEEVKEAFRLHSHGDLLIDYIFVVSALDPSDGMHYSTLVTPGDQRPAITSGLARLGMVASDKILSDGLDFGEEETDDDE